MCRAVPLSLADGAWQTEEALAGDRDRGPATSGASRARVGPVVSRLRHLNRGTAPCAVVCDGLVVASDVTPEQAVAAMDADLASRA